MLTVGPLRQTCGVLRIACTKFLCKRAKEVNGILFLCKMSEWYFRAGVRKRRLNGIFPLGFK
jgi:hypothetical protein